MPFCLVAILAAALLPQPGVFVARSSATAKRPPIVCCDAPGPPPPPLPPPTLAAPPRSSEVDARGFVVPQVRGAPPFTSSGTRALAHAPTRVQVGDVVKMPSKWPGEWEVAQVDFVQTTGSTGTTEVRHLSSANSPAPRRGRRLSDVLTQKTSI